MSIENAVRKKAVLLERVGKKALNLMFPDEFEFYTCALELVNAEGKSLKYFLFPVMPSNLEESQPRATTIKRTLGGVVSLSSTTFNPVDISLSGTFGRKLRILLGSNFTDLVSAFSIPMKDGVKPAWEHVKEVFDDRVKTGYGCLKVMEEILRDADKIDAAGPRFLIFYNLAFGNSYYVKPISFKITMSEQSNMLHNYALSLKAIAPVDAIAKAADRAKELKEKTKPREKIGETVNKITRTLKSIPI